MVATWQSCCYALEYLLMVWLLSTVFSTATLVNSVNVRAREKRAPHAFTQKNSSQSTSEYVSISARNSSQTTRSTKLSYAPNSGWILTTGSAFPHWESWLH